MDELIKMASTEAARDAFVYYITVIVACELARFVCDRIFAKNSSSYLFFIEFLGTLQVTTTIFENAVVDIYFGRKMFAITLFTMGIVFAFCTRGAFCSPLAPIELYLFKGMSLYNLIRTLSAQISAGYVSYRFARTIWTQTYIRSIDAHPKILSMYETCRFNHPHHLYNHLAIELIGAFFIRHVLTRATSDKRDPRFKLIFPAFFMASVFTTIVTYIGDQALDPLVASTLFYGCRGIDLQHFMLIYWIAPTLGWMASAYYDNMNELKSKKSVKKAEKKLKKSKKND